MTAAPAKNSLPPALCLWLSRKGVTPREADVVRSYFKLRRRGDGVVSPSQREIAADLDISCPTVCMHVANLAAKGVFAGVNGKWGAMRLLWDERPAGDDGDIGPLRVEARACAAFLRSHVKAVRPELPRTADLLESWADRLAAAVDGRGER